MSDEPEAGERERARRGAPWGRRALALLVGFVLVLGVAAALGWRAFPGLLHSRVLAEARRRGVTLVFAELEPRGLFPWQPGPRALRMREVGVELEGLSDLSVEAEEATVRLSGGLLQPVPNEVELGGLSVRAPDLAALLALEGRMREPALAEVPVTSRDVTVRVGRVIEGLPVSAVLSIDRLEVEDGAPSYAGVEVSASVPLLFDVGPIAVELERTEGRVVVVPSSARFVRLGLDPSGDRAFVDVGPTKLDSTLARLVDPRLAGHRFGGHVEVQLSGPKAPSGALSGFVDGWIPPHPKELGGIVFGDTTRVSARFERTGAGLTLRDVKVDAGALSLAGTGRVSLDDGGTLSLDLRGSIPCNELATSAVGAHLGLEAGAIARELGRGRLRGSVAVRVTIEARAGALGAARVVPAASVGCRLSLP